MGLMQREKGQKGMREAAKWLEANGVRVGGPTQQGRSGKDAPDRLVEGDFWLEVKRVEDLHPGTGEMAATLERAERDAAGRPFGVLHRKNRGQWALTAGAVVNHPDGARSFGQITYHGGELIAYVLRAGAERFREEMGTKRAAERAEASDDKGHDHEGDCGSVCNGACGRLQRPRQGAGRCTRGAGGGDPNSGGD